MNKIDKNNKEQLRQTIAQMHKLDQEINKEKNKKQIIIILSIIFLTCIFKIFIGKIDIVMPNLFSQHQNRLYKIELNEQIISIGIEDYKKTTIIPFVLDYTIFSSHRYYEDIGVSRPTFEKGDEINLLISSFDCYNSKIEHKVSCVGTTNNANKLKTNDTEYSLIIRKTSRGENVFYNGKLIDNIGKYFVEKGSYIVFIKGKYQNVTSVVYFTIIIEDTK